MCSGCKDCTLYRGRCCQNIGKSEKKWTEKGKQIGALCTKNRDDRGTGLDDLDESGARSSTQPMHVRVGTLETQDRGKGCKGKGRSPSSVGTLETHDRGNGKGLFKGLHGPSSSSSSQLEQRVGMLEAQTESLQQSLPQALQQHIDLRDSVGLLQTLVESLQQRLDGALQRVAELEATVGNWQSEQDEWQLLTGSSQ